jgi:anaerobic ribonucleoside-triphosphate reductase activating protein
MELNLAAFLRYSTVNGPGKRAVVWVQGCPIRCPGCFNPGMWSPDPAMQCDTEYLADVITGIPGIQGVTFSGGEPFCQAAALGDLGTRLRETGLDILTFSGYPFDVLRLSPDPGWQCLLSLTDLLVAGPYIAEMHSNLPLLGSSNQQIVALSGRLSAPGSMQDGHPVELTITPEGDLIISGFPDPSLCRKGGVLPPGGEA